MSLKWYLLHNRSNLLQIYISASISTLIWSRSTHTCLINPTISDALRIVTGCLRPIPADNLPIFAGIQHAELHSSRATLSLACCAVELGHLLHSALTQPSSADAWHLKSRHPFVPTAQQLISSTDNNNIRAAHWADHQWNAEWANNSTRLSIFIPDTSTQPPSWGLS